MIRIFPKLLSAAIVCTSLGLTADDNTANRSGWYVGAALGVLSASDIEQSGYNRDTVCYPDSACFDGTPIPSVSGYRWFYDIGLEQGSDFNLSLGRFFGSKRIELGLVRQTSNTDQTFAGISYFDGSAILPREGNPVSSNAMGSINQRRLLGVTIDGFYDFPTTLGSLTPYIGAGIGVVNVNMKDVRFETNYTIDVAFSEPYDPELSYYGSRQDEDLTDSTFGWRLHIGADRVIGDRNALGVRATWSNIGEIEAEGIYQRHPIHDSEPDFRHVNTFSQSSQWVFSLTIRRSLGE